MSGGGMFEGGRTSHVDGAWPACVQANPPTTGAAIVVLVVGSSVLVEDDSGVVEVTTVVEVDVVDVVVVAEMEAAVEVDVAGRSVVAAELSPGSASDAGEFVSVAQPPVRIITATGAAKSRVARSLRNGRRDTVTVWQP